MTHSYRLTEGQLIRYPLSCFESEVSQRGYRPILCAGARDKAILRPNIVCMLRELARFMAGEFIEGLIPEKVIRARRAVGRKFLWTGLFLFLLGFVAAIRLEEEGLGDFGFAVIFIGFIFITVGIRLRWERLIGNS